MGNSHAVLDELKRRIAVEVVAFFPSSVIRKHSLANLRRWRKQGVWVDAFESWRLLLTKGSDEALFAVMLGKDDRSVELRNSPPYVGLLEPEEVRRLNREVVGGKEIRDDVAALEQETYDASVVQGMFKKGPDRGSEDDGTGAAKSHRPRRRRRRAEKLPP